MLIVDGHPRENSFCAALVEAYKAGAVSASSKVNVIALRDLEFNYACDPTISAEVEPDLMNAQQLISQADHVIWIYPSWWGSTPAILKAFIDRTFLPGFAFVYEGESAMPKRLLLGKTASIIVTMDAPKFWNKFVYRKSSTTWLRYATLWFSGFKVRNEILIPLVRKQSQVQRERWISKIRALGKQEAS